MSRYLLIQIRKDKVIKHQELMSFCKYSGIPESKMQAFDAFDLSGFSQVNLHDFDGVFIGGASDANVLKPKEFAFVPLLQDWIHEILELNIPTFASCFGFQIALQALGAEILHQDQGFEMGTVSIQLDPLAAHDPIFAGVVNPFLGVSVHQQKVEVLPDSCQRLAFTQACVHAFKVINKDFWGFQFHPEVDKQTLVDRLTFYKNKYTSSADQLNRVIAQVSSTPDSHKLIKNFAKKILGVHA